MKLSIKERILLPAILPSEGKMIEMIINRSIKNKLVFTEDEITDFELVDNDNGSISFNPKKHRDVEIEFTSEQLNILKKAVNSIDEAGKVTDDLLPIFEKILAV